MERNQPRGKKQLTNTTLTPAHSTTKCQTLSKETGELEIKITVGIVNTGVHEPLAVCEAGIPNLDNGMGFNILQPG